MASGTLGGSPIAAPTLELSKSEQWLHDKKVTRMAKMCSERFHEIEVLSGDKWVVVVDVHARKGPNGTLEVRDMNTGIWSPIVKDGWRHVRPPNE